MNKGTVLLFVVLIGIGCSKNNDTYIFSKGTGTIRVKPDRISLKLGVSTINESADSAINSTNSKVDSMISVMARFGISKDGIETYRNVLERAYQNNRDTATYLGIKSEVILHVDFGNIKETEKLLNSLIDAGMNVLMNYDFEHSEKDSLTRAAADIAIADARRNADIISKREKRHLGSLLNASYERPDDFQTKADFDIDYSDLHEGTYLALKKRGGLRVGDGKALRYFRIYVPYLTFENTVFAKFLLR